MQKRIGELDALRGIAILAVMFFHYTTWYDNLFGHVKKDYKLSFDYGYLGVQLFFIISGFVIFMTLERCKTAKDFAFKRATRLYPAYVFGVIVTFTIVSLYGLKGRTVSFWEALVNLTMLQGHIPGIDAVDGAYWSLSVELTFYVMIAVIFFTGKFKNVELVSICWLVLSGVISFINLQFDNQMIFYLNKLMITYYVQLFIAGIMFYKLSKDINNKPAHVVIFLCMIYSFMFNKFMEAILITVFFVVFYLIILEKMKFLNNKVLLFFGNISYCLYLIHQNIGYVIINFLEKNGFIDEWVLIIPITISTLLAIFMTYYIEKPIQKALRNRQKLIIRAEKVYNRI